MTASRFYVRRDGERLGPFTLEELGQLLRDGALDRRTGLEDETGAGTTLGELLPDGPLSPVPPDSPAPAPLPATREEEDEAVRPPVPSLSPWQWAWTGLIAVAGGYFLLRRPESFLDWVDLPFHEAGHVFFGIFGEFAGFLGGTLMQLLVPGVVAYSFARAGRTAGARFALFWLGQSFLNVARYAADARAVNLPLIGGEHDWNYLLGRLGLLAYDAEAGMFFAALGAVSFLAAAAWPFLAGSRRGSA